MKWLLPAILALLLLGAQWSPHAPEQQYRDHTALAPQCGNPCFLFGTDALGRDVFSRFLHGARVSLLAGVGATLIALLAGAAMGMVAATGGWLVDGAFSRLCEMVLSVPWLYLLLALRALIPLDFDGELTLVSMMMLLGIAGMPVSFQLSRQITRSTLAGKPVEAALGLGATRWHVARRHLLPAALPALLEQGLVLWPQFVVAEVSLSFLGLGAGEGVPSWGAVIAPMREYAVMREQWWLFAPVLVLAVVCCLLAYRVEQGWQR